VGTEGGAEVAGVAAIRELFPALDRLHGGLAVAYFDGPGGTQVPGAVAEAMKDYLLAHNANTHWPYPTSEETDEALLEARRTVADFLNGRPEEVVFGANMTTLTFHLGRALARRWRAGDEVVVTELDHHANIDTWRALESERGIVTRVVPMIPQTGQLDVDALERILGPQTRLVAVGGASNALGTINDLARIGAATRGAGALLFVDGVHSAPHVLPDVQSLGCDFFVFSPYKLYGPHLGVLWGRHELLEALDAPRLMPAADTAPEKLETGTLSHEAIVGTDAAIRFIAGLASAPTRRLSLERAYGALHERGQSLFARLWEGLVELRRVQLYGPPPGGPRTPTLAFHIDGSVAEQVGRTLADRALFLSTGDFYATTAIERLGRQPHGVLRAGCAAYTTEQEIDRLIAAVERIGS
jgi:cysteine desulfurase family protein (TIGR01976 family)